MSETNLVIFVQ